MFRKPALFCSLLCLAFSKLLGSEIIEISASASQSGMDPAMPSTEAQIQGGLPKAKTNGSS